MPDPKAPQAHDILLIPQLKPVVVQSQEAHGDPAVPTGVLHMPVQEDGQYARSKLLDVRDEGGRKIYNIARPDDDERYGPGFAVLPIRPDPGSQSDTCFLINTENLVLPNPWTAADWDVLEIQGEGEPASNIEDPSRGDDPVAEDERLIVAGPRGKVYVITFPKGGAPGKVDTIKDLGTQVSIWSQLREGLIVGTAMYKSDEEKDGKPVVLFNLTSVNVKDAKGAKS